MYNIITTQERNLLLLIYYSYKNGKFWYGKQDLVKLYSATDYKIPKLTFVFIEFLRQYDVCY